MANQLKILNTTIAHVEVRRSNQLNAQLLFNTRINSKLAKLKREDGIFSYIKRHYYGHLAKYKLYRYIVLSNTLFLLKKEDYILGLYQ